MGTLTNKYLTAQDMIKGRFARLGKLESALLDGGVNMAKKNSAKEYDDFGRRDEVLDFVAEELLRLVKRWPTYKKLGMEGELKRMIRYLTGAYVAPRTNTADVLRSEKANERLRATNNARGLVYDHVVPLEELFKILQPD